jgi:hypothetical protein
MAEFAFQQLERAHEARFKLDQETRFKAECRRNRLLGLWAAELMGLGSEERDQYARQLVAFNMETPGAGNLIRKVAADLDNHGVPQSENEIGAALSRFLAKALAELSGEFPRALDSDHVTIGG